MKELNIKYYASLLLVCLITGCSNSRVVWTNTVPERYHDEVKAGRGSAVFYRLDEALPNTVNIYINSEYLGSLSKKSYLQSEVCPGMQVFYANQSGVDKSYYGKYNAGHNFMVSEGDIVYFKVINEAGKASLWQVDAMQAQSEISSLARQNHTLSRVKQNQNCINI